MNNVIRSNHVIDMPFDLKKNVEFYYGGIGKVTSFRAPALPLVIGGKT